MLKRCKNKDYRPPAKANKTTNPIQVCGLKIPFQQPKHGKKGNFFHSRKQLIFATRSKKNELKNLAPRQ